MDLKMSSAKWWPSMCWKPVQHKQNRPEIRWQVERCIFAMQHKDMPQFTTDLMYGSRMIYRRLSCYLSRMCQKSSSIHNSYPNADSYELKHFVEINKSLHVFNIIHPCLWRYIFKKDKNVILNQCGVDTGIFQDDLSIQRLLMSWPLPSSGPIEFLSTCCKIAYRCMSQSPSDEKLTLVQVMAWCHLAPSHYLNQCWLPYMPQYSITRPH